MNRTKPLRIVTKTAHEHFGRPPVLFFNTSLFEGPYSSLTCLFPHNAAAYAHPIFGATILGAVKYSTPRVSSPRRAPPLDSVVVLLRANIHRATMGVPVKHTFLPRV